MKDASLGEFRGNDDFRRNLPFRHGCSRGIVRSLVSRLSPAVLALVMLVLAAPSLSAQTGASPDAKRKPVSTPIATFNPDQQEIKIAAVKSFRIVQEKNGPALEILSTEPLVPSIHALGGPDRLVVDLPNARLDTEQKRINVQADQITTLRADQFQQNPPVARVVVDLLGPRAYSWDAAGNRLVVHLGRNPNEGSDSPFQPPSSASLTPGPQPVVAAVRAAGPLAIAEMTIAERDAGTGSTIAAGANTSIVSLSSGGEVHVCPGTTVALTPSQNRHNLMFSMSTGAIEAHLALDASSDSIITPDFRILLPGPGEFHYAISTDNQGNTCVRSLPGNTASAIVSELLGDRTYQVKATDQLVFRAGQLDHVDSAVPLECGCPPAREAPMRASNDLAEHDVATHDLPPQAQPALNSTTAASTSVSAIAHAERAPSTSVRPASPQLDASAASNDPHANDLHVQVEMPFSVHATGPPPAPGENARALLSNSRPQGGVAPAAQPPPAGTETASAKQPPERGFFKKLGGFLASLFH